MDDYEFPPLTPEQAIREANTLRRIAAGLGAKLDWRGAEDLEWIAMAITRTGLPNPGISDTLAFYENAEASELPAPVNQDIEL